MTGPASPPGCEMQAHLASLESKELGKTLTLLHLSV